MLPVGLLTKFDAFQLPTRFRQYWQQLQESLWFVLGLLALSSFGFAYGLVELDAHTSWDEDRKLIIREQVDLLMAYAE